MKQNKKNILALSLLALLLIAVPASAQWSTSNYSGTQLPSGTIYNIIQTLMKWLLAIFSLVGIIGFTISGIQYLTAAGDEDQQQRAKKAMYYSIMGVVVGLSGLVIIVAVSAMLGGSSTTF